MRRIDGLVVLTCLSLSFAAVGPPAGAEGSPQIAAATQSFPGAGPEKLVDGLMDVPAASWASPGSPNWVEVDLGQPRLITEVSVAPFIGASGAAYFYNNTWTVQYRDELGDLQEFTNVQKLVGAGTLIGPGITITDGDPGSTTSYDSYKYYGFRIDPISTRYIRFTVLEGDRDGDSNGAELEVRQGFLVGSPVTLDASASDAEDGDLSNSITWSSDRDGLIGSGASITISDLSIGDHTITALIEDSQGAQSLSTTQLTIVDSLPVTHALTTTITGTGGGTVNSSPAGINCGADCSEAFDEGTVVTLTVTPDAGSRFVGWSGNADCTDGSVTMNQAHSCTATFDLLPANKHKLTAGKIGTGSGTVRSAPTGIDCGPDCSEDYEAGTVVSLQAMPGNGSVFAGWRGDDDCIDGAVTMSDIRSCTAVFNAETTGGYVLTVSRSGSGVGTVTSDPAGIDCGEDCTHHFDRRTSVTLNAVAAADSVFAGWRGDGDCRDAVITMRGGRNCEAIFESADTTTRSLAVHTAGGGSGTVTSSPTGIDCGNDCLHNYPQGVSVVLETNPDNGSYFVGWSGDADCSDGQITMTDDHDCTATFELQTPDSKTLSILLDGNGSGTVTSSPAGIDCAPDCAYAFAKGTVVTLTATPAEGSKFSGWSGPGGCKSGEVNLSKARTCNAIFDRVDALFTDGFDSGGTERW